MAKRWMLMPGLMSLPPTLTAACARRARRGAAWRQHSAHSAAPALLLLASCRPQACGQRMSCSPTHLGVLQPGRPAGLPPLPLPHLTSTMNACPSCTRASSWCVATISGRSSFITPSRRLYSPAHACACVYAWVWGRRGRGGGGKAGAGAGRGVGTGHAAGQAMGGNLRGKLSRQLSWSGVQAGGAAQRGEQCRAAPQRVSLEAAGG